MGNSLGCVKEQTEAVTGQAGTPQSLKRKHRFRRKKKGVKRIKQADDTEEPLDVTRTAEDAETQKKFRAEPLPQEQEDPVVTSGDGMQTVVTEGMHLTANSGDSPVIAEEGHMVLVREKLYGELQKPQLLSRMVRELDNSEEVTKVIARIWENSQKGNVETAVTHLAGFMEDEDYAVHYNTTFFLDGWHLPVKMGATGWRCDRNPSVGAKSETNIQDVELNLWDRVESEQIQKGHSISTESSGLGGREESCLGLSVSWHLELEASEACGEGTVSELSTPSLLGDVLEYKSVLVPQKTVAKAWISKEGKPKSCSQTDPKLSVSHSDFSFGTQNLSTAQHSSGYGSDAPLASPEAVLTDHGGDDSEPKDSCTEGSTLSILEDEFTASSDERPLAESLHAEHEISDIYVSGESGDMSAKEKLLLWTQKLTMGYPGIKCTNFSSCFSDGKMFNAILHRYRPDLIDMEKVQIQSNQENLEQAFEVAEMLGVTRLLDVEDIDVPSPDEKSVITYVSTIYESFPKIPEGAEGISAIDVDLKWQEYKDRIDFLIQWIRQHSRLMADKSFPSNPVELKALYNEYVHFKETEIPAKEEEKSKIEHLYKLLEVWIEFGRIKLPQGYHPNDVEQEWGRLIFNMLEREKAMRPAVERLELLLQIANKIQNGALSCEEKMTVARNTLQADAAQLESGQPVQYETEVVMYLQECEGLIRQLQVDLQILRDEKYYQVDQLAFRIGRLQDELLPLRLECTNLYRKGHFSNSELLRPSNLISSEYRTERSLGTLPTTTTTSSSSTLWFRKPMTRAELVALSSTEDEGNLRFVYELLAWVEETQMKLEQAEWGSDLPSVEAQHETHQSVHNSVEQLESSLKEARMYESKMSSNFRSSYTETLCKLESQYYKLLETSSLRLRHLNSLHKFVSHATVELIWLNEREEEELAYDWSDNNPNIAAKEESFLELTNELEQKEDTIKSLQETAEMLSLENHPAKQTVEAYSAAVQTQWNWIKELCLCVDQHIRDNTAYFQFFSDARELELYLRNLQDRIKRKYVCDRDSSLSRLEDNLQDSMDEKEQLIQSKSSVASLVGRAKTIIQLKPRNPENVVTVSLPIKAICNYKQIEITISKNDECVLEDNCQRTKWKVISPTGNEAMVPSVCFVIPPPNKEAVETAGRIEQLYQNVMSLWHQQHINMKSVVSWNYVLKDMKTVQAWNVDLLKSVSLADQQQSMRNLQAHFEDFLEDSRDSQVFSIADRMQLERDVESCKEHYQSLKNTMETEAKDESLTRTYVSQLKNIRLHLEECEQRLVRRIQSPTGDDNADQNTAFRIAEQEHLQKEIEGLKSEIGDFSEKCQSFFFQSPSATSVPSLRSELNLAVEKMDQIYALSSVYLDKLKTVDVVLRNAQGVETLVKTYEMKLNQEEPVPADLQAIQTHQSLLQKWLGEVKEKETLFTTLEIELMKAKTIGDQLSQLNNERNIDLERQQERVGQLKERWQNIHSQIETRHSELENIEEALHNYRSCHGWLMKWIEETKAQQEQMKPGQGEDSRVLSEQLTQQTALVAEIEQNQSKLDECQKYSQQYSSSVKEYEMQLMKYQAYVESQQKSPVKRRRMHSSSDSITQEFMDLRTRYTALVTLTTQHVKYISDALRRLEEEEKVVEEEKQEHVGKMNELLGWVSGVGQALQQKVLAVKNDQSGDLEKSYSELQVFKDELESKKESVADAIRTAQIFLAKHGHKMSEEEKQQVTEQLNSLKDTYAQLCGESAEQLQQLQSTLTEQAERKVVQEQQAECSRKLDELTSWMAQVESSVNSQQVLLHDGELSTLQQSQNDVQNLQKELQARAANVSDVIKATEEFLEENRGKLTPDELTRVQDQLQKAKEKQHTLLKSTETMQKQLDSAVSAAVQKEEAKAKASEGLLENQSKINSLLGWVSSMAHMEPTKLGNAIKADSVSGLQAVDGTVHQLSTSHDEAVNSSSEMGGNLTEQYEKLKARHQELLSQHPDFLLSIQSAQAFLDKHGKDLPPEERERLQRNLKELKANFSLMMAQTESSLKQAQLLRDELQKFLAENTEFDTWLLQSEQKLEQMKSGKADVDSLRSLIQQQAAFSEDVISHKGDLRYITIAGQKVLDMVRTAEEEKAPGEDKGSPDYSATSTLVAAKLKNSTDQYSLLHSECSRLGSHLSSLLEKSQQFQEIADSLESWLQRTESTAEHLLSEVVASDPNVLRTQLENTKVLQGELAEHQVQVDKLKKAASTLLDLKGDPSLNQENIQQSADSITERYDHLCQQLFERCEKLQLSVAQSQSVQEGLESLLNWVEGVEKNLEGQRSVPALSSAIQDAIADVAKVKQDLASHNGSVDATREMVCQFLEKTDKSTAATLQDKLSELNDRVSAVCTQQREKEEVLKGILPKVELYEELSREMQNFTDCKSKVLAAGNRPDKDITQFSQQIKELNSEMCRQQVNMQTLQHVTNEIGECNLLANASHLQEAVQKLSETFNKLQETVKEREKETFSCQQQLSDFRGLVDVIRKWLMESEAAVPSAETSVNREELMQRKQLVKTLLTDWTAKGLQIEEVNKKGNELETLIIEVTSPDMQTKSGFVLSSAVGMPAASTNGYHTCKDLTEIQCNVSDVNQGYENLGALLKDREKQLGTVIDQMCKVEEEASLILKWLEQKEQTLSALNASPSKTDAVKVQVDQNKALISDLEQNAEKVQKLKETLHSLLQNHPDSPEAEKWKTMLEEIGSKWTYANQVTAERQQKLEKSVGHLTTFQTAEAQLNPWLTEKELMMSVLGPLSIDPNMLNAQKQQVQFMLKEFETRTPQYEQLNQSAEGILSSPEDISHSCSQIQDQLTAVNDKWNQLTGRLSTRSEQIDQAIVKSTEYQDLLQLLSERVKAIGQRLSSQGPISTQPDAVKQQLEETSEIRSDLEQQQKDVEACQILCEELSALVGEQYLKDELKKRLEAIVLPLRSLEDAAGERVNQLQTALASSQQFQQMFDELRSWLDTKRSQQSQSSPISAICENLQTQILEQEEFQKSLNQHAGSYEMIVSEGESLLLSVQPGEEKTALQSQLTTLKAHWDELGKQAGDRYSKIKDCMQKAQKYRHHVEDLLPWIENCEARVENLEVTMEPSQLETSLLSAKSLQYEVEKHRSLLEMLNSAADILLDACQADEDEVRDEKAGINQRMDIVTEQVQGKTSSIEELGQRLKEFQENLRNIEKKLEGAKQQLEIYDALGPQACSNKNLERLKTQQETLQALQPQVDYLKNLTQGLVEDAPAGSDASHLLNQAEVIQQEYSNVKHQVNECCQSMENKLQGIGQFHSHVREMFSQLADLDDELDCMSPIGRDIDSLQSQIEDIRRLMGKLLVLRTDIESSEKECRQMLETEGSPDLLSLKRELEALNKQCSKLTERGRNRQEQLETTLTRVKEFYDRLKEVNQLMNAAEEGETLQGVVGTEVDIINQQLASFKSYQKERVDPIQIKLQQVNGLGQGLIQSAGKNADIQGLEHDLEDSNVRWNTLNKKVAERITQLQEALLHCGKFQDALEPLLSWLTDTEDLISNQKAPSAEYKVVKAQIQEQKLLQRLLDDRKATVEIIKAEGERIAHTAEPADKEKINKQLLSLTERWDALLGKAAARQKQLEDILVLAKEFHETMEPLADWLIGTEKKLANSEPVGTQTAKIQQQITRHKALNEEILSRKKNMEQAVKNGQALLKQTTGEEVLIIQEKLDSIKTRHAEITATSSKALKTLEQALQLATKFQSTHEELSGWLDTVEEELSSSERLSPVGEQIPQFQQRQKELKNEVMEHRLVLDTINEVSTALLELVPWRAREGLDRLVSEANTRYKSVSDIVAQRVEQIDAAIQRSQQYEQATDAELAWVVETKRKLMALGPIRLEQDQTTAQLQVQKAFSIDIIRHKDSIDELVKTEDEILGACGEEQKTSLQEKTASLLQKYEEVSLQNSERYALLERAQVLVNQFWETHEELSPWLDEILSFITRLPPPAIDPEILKQQQDEMRQLREEVAEHKPHIDKLLKIGPQLSDLNPEEAELVSSKYSTAEALYARIKDKVRQRAMALDEAVAQSTQFHDKIEPMLEALEHLADRLRSPPSIPAEMDKIREQISENKNIGMELEKLQPSFEALKHRGEELISRSQGVDKDPSAKAIQERVDQMVFFWDEIKVRAEERETKLLDVLELAEKFWYDMTALLSTIRDTQEIVRDLEEPGIDPSIIKQQMEAAEAIKEETDGLHEELEFVRILGTDLIFACGETEKPEVKKSIDEMNNAWENLNKSWKERMDKLQDAMLAAVLYQDALQGMFDWLDNAVIRLCDLSPVGTDIETVKQQINEMKEFKMDIYQQQVEMEKLNHQGDLMLKKASDDTDRDIIQEPLTELKHLWENLDEKITQRQHKLEAALLALGQFTHALAELMAWITHTEELLDAQRPISSDPKFIEIELAKHHVLKNDVLAHQVTVQTVNKAGNELLESSAGDDASNLQQCLDKLKHCWESVLQKTEEREQQLESALQMAQGFHGDVEDFFQWLSKMETQLSVSKPMGGLPETAREQLNSHMEIYNEFKSKEETYRQLLDKGRLMLLSREDASGSNTEQSLALLEQKWQSVSTKMEERKSKLEDVLNLATEFQNSLQDFINWLTQAEQTLNMAPPPSLILDTVLSQVEEHKAFLNEVNSHREHIMELDKTGNQLKFLSQKQDVVLIKNLLISMKSRWDKVVQRSFERGKALDDARKRAKQFCDAWRKLVDWLEEAESHLDSDLDISNEPDKIKLQLSKHKEFQKTLGVKQPVYDTTIRTGRSMKEKAALSDDVPKLENVLGEVRDKWDTVCGKSIERQNKLEEALLFSGQFTDALQALVDWLYKVEPQLAEDQPVHGDLDLVMNLMDAHKVFQKELGKRTGSVQALKRSARELLENSRDDTTWVKVQLQELSTRWDTVCKLSLSKQSRLEQALKQAEEFRTAVQILLEWLSEAEQTLRFRGALPDDPEALQSLIDVHKEFMKKVEEKRVDVNRAAGMGEAILAVCHPDCITTVKHWITIIRARFEEVLTWARQHQQRLELALAELISNANLLDDLLSWLQWAETTLIQQDQEPIPQAIEQVKDLISQHQSFMEEMTRKQPDVDKLTKTYKRKSSESTHATYMDKTRNRKSLNQNVPPTVPLLSQPETKNPRINQLSGRWQQVWLLALERQRKLNDALDRLEELKEFANFDFDVWRKKYMRWMNHKKSRVMDFFRRIDKDQDGKITRQEFIDGILASKFPTTKLEMTAVADIFDRDCDGYIDYYEFVAALHPNKDAYRPTTDADKIEDEVTRQVAQCKCAKRFQVEQIGENKYRFFLGNQFGDSQQLRLVRILRSTVMVRVGGGWMALDEFLVKNDPCRARGRTNLELREKFILPEGMSQGMAPFRSRGRRSKPSSRTASPTRSSSSTSHSNHSCASMPSSPATPASGTKTPQQFTRFYDKPWLTSNKTSTPVKAMDQCHCETTPNQGSKLKRPAFHSSKGSLTGETSTFSSPPSTSAKPSRTDPKKTTSRPTSQAGSRTGSRTSSRRGSDASDFDHLETQSACSDLSETSTPGTQAGSRRGSAKPSKIPTISKKVSASPKTPTTKR